MYFFLLSYSILGAGIKYIDDAFDEKTFSKIIAVVLTPLLSILGVYAMFIDPVSATILLAIIGGVLIKGKVDNYAFMGGAFLVICLVLIARIDFLIIPLIILGSAAILDEVGNDYIDNNKDSLNRDKLTYKFAVYFFGQRWIMKVLLLFLVLTNIIPFYFFFAMILFDYAYQAVNLYSKIKQGKANTWTARKALAIVGYIFK